MPDAVLAQISADRPSVASLLDPADFAWEILRRNPSYRAHVTLRAADARKVSGVSILTAATTVSPWGLQFRGKLEDSRTSGGIVLASAS